MSLYGQVGRVGFRKVLERDDFEEVGERAAKFRCGWQVGDDIWEHEIVLDPAGPTERLHGPRGQWSWRPRERSLSANARKFKGSKSLAYRSLAQLTPKEWQLESNVPGDIFGPTSISMQFRVPLAHLFQPESLAKMSHVSVERPHRSGFGWAHWLQAVINRRDGTVEALESAITKIFPYFKQVRVFVDDGTKSLHRHAILGSKYGTTDVRERRIEINLANGRTIRAKKASSGLLLALAHLSQQPLVLST